MTNLAVDPLKRSRDKVALVGMAQTSRHLAPWDDPEFEIWAMNESMAPKNVDPDGHPYLKRWDRLFQMHPDWDFLRAHNFNWDDYSDWIINKGGNRRRTDFPVYMLEDYSDIVPGCFVYPYNDILNEFAPNQQRVRYFTSSFPYEIALAIKMGFKEMHLYGVEMSSEEEYSYQKPAAEFWLGVAIGRGIKVELPKGCKLLGETVPLYGYEKSPGITTMHMEIKLNEARRQVAKLQQEVNRLRGVKQRLFNEQKVTKGATNKTKMRLQKEMSEAIEAEVNALIALNSAIAQEHSFSLVVSEMKALPDPSDIKLITPGEGSIKVTDIREAEEVSA